MDRNDLDTNLSAHSASAPGHTRLVVFSDDWGRHPSSCQHLIRHLLDRYPTLWVNTIGTRFPRLEWGDLRKITHKLRQWLQGTRGPAQLPANLTTVSPLMYPGFRTRWQRRFNQKKMAQAVHQNLHPSGMGLHKNTGNATAADEPASENRIGTDIDLPAPHGSATVAITTLPITADLIGHLRVDRWVYYCVDDFSVWPGLDGSVMDALERQLVAKADRIVAVSTTLQRRITAMGRESSLLTHGIDLAHWGGAPGDASSPPPQATPGETPHAPPGWDPQWARPVFLFWGVVDQRLDTAWCQALAQQCGTLVLVGPTQSPDPQLRSLAHMATPGPVAYQDLPAWARAADVLVMPYADLPVTRAIQPLKLKEYLATGKPAVVRRLPATEPWADAADVVDTLDQFIQAAKHRAAHGTPPHQRQARQRLTHESWATKAQQFEQAIRSGVEDTFPG